MSLSLTLAQYMLPDLLAKFPWPRRLSKYYEDCKTESRAWTESYHPFDDEGQRGFNLCDFNLLASLAYSPRNKDIIRLGCDLMNLFYVYDEYTDIMDGIGALKIRNVVMDALRNPHKPRPSGECPVGIMAQDFWIRASNLVTNNAHCLRHFVDAFDTYTAAVIQEADDRNKQVYRNFQSYLTIRRNSSGCLPSFALCEFGLDLPEAAYHHPVMDTLRQQATDLIAIGNDINSYALEKSRGLELHNSVELVMKERNLDIQCAVDWLEQYAQKVLDSFLVNIASVPSWGQKIDRKLDIYIHGLAQWVRGNDDWTFESGRYFGEKGREVQKTRVALLHPPSTGFVNPGIILEEAEPLTVG